MLVPKLVDRFDEAVDQKLARFRQNKAADRVAYLASEIADYSVGWHLLGLGISIVDPNLVPHTIRMALTLGAESAIVNGGIKPLVKRDRPDQWEGAATHSVRRPKTYSFPSGHSSSGVVAATMLSAAVPQLRPAWWTLTAVVAWSRAHTRMHHASDIAAGAAIGWLISVIARRLYPLAGNLDVHAGG